MRSMVVFENVCKRYREDDSPVFQNFSESIEEGEFLILTGKSGSGKSTLISMLLKETEPDSGRIVVNGRDISGIGQSEIPFYRRSLGVIFQDFRLFDDYTVFGNLEVALALTGGDRSNAERRVTDILKLLKIDRLFRRYPGELSGGEKQKVCMARALINDPMVLLADEPTGNLDPSSSAEIMKLLELVHRRGKTVIMATHDIATAEEHIKTGRTLSLDYI